MAVFVLNSGGHSALPINLLGQAKRWLTRSQQEDLIERLIEHIDWLDPDPDLEPGGDELDGNRSEDDFMDHSPFSLGQAGCCIADPAEDAGDREDSRQPETLN